MTDLLLIETGNGGDLVLRGNDLVAIYGYENALYLAMFGGSKWWGNYMEENKFQSKTEETLRTTPLTSAGRVKIEQAVLDDIAFLKKIEGTTYSAAVKIMSEKLLQINITINGKTFSFEWNPDTLFLNYRVPL